MGGLSRGQGWPAHVIQGHMFHSTCWLEIWQRAPFTEKCQLFLEEDKGKALNDYEPLREVSLMHVLVF